MSWGDRGLNRISSASAQAACWPILNASSSITRLADTPPPTATRLHKEIVVSNLIVEEFYAMDYGPAPEDPKEVERWLDGHKRTFDLYINGAWKKPASDEYFATNNPANGD